MGLLDDAIREHLDLKRRRGADPAEIDRAERDALGPVRRGPEEEEEKGVDVDHAAAMDEDDAAYEAGDEQDWAEHHAHEPEERGPAPARDYEPPFEDEEEPRHSGRPFDGEEPFDEPAAQTTPEPYAASEPPRPGGSENPRPGASEAPRPGASEAPPPAASEPPRPDPDPPASAPARPDPDDHADGETAEFNVEFEGQGGAEGEDVLEETPEFLQDTPDHDRLWFEQRPPKDFDFDG
jgi:hypothetical protein